MAVLTLNWVGRGGTDRNGTWVMTRKGDIGGVTMLGVFSDIGMGGLITDP
jgi:hypothetical protein